MHVKEYMEKLDKEIEELIQREARELSATGEDNLYILLENRKNVKRWKEMKHEKDAHPEHVEAATTEHKDESAHMTKNPY